MTKQSILTALIKAAKARVDEVQTAAQRTKSWSVHYPDCVKDPCGDCSYCLARAALKAAEGASGA